MINKMAFARYIKDKQINTKQKIMVEIGSTRSISEQDSTFHLATFCNENDIHFITVDVDKNNIEMAKKRFENINPFFEAILSRGEDFLKIFDKKIDFLYLDGFDFYHPFHSQERIDNYKKYLNMEITDENCWNMHLECVKNYIIKNNGIICIHNVFDNNHNGKGKLAISFLLKNNYIFEKLENECAFLYNDNKKVNQENLCYNINKVSNITIKIIPDENNNSNVLIPIPNILSDDDLKIQCLDL
jgi:hypothetical protein